MNPTFTDDGRVIIGDMELAVNQWHDDLVLRAMVPGELPLAAIESAEGILLFLSEEGPLLALEPSLQSVNPDVPESVFIEKLMSATGDPLAEALLADGEPSWRSVRAALVPVVDYTFAGDPRTDERVIIAADGSIEGLLEPLTDLSWDELRGRAEWGTIDSRLPLPVMRVWTDTGACIEQTVAVTLDAGGELKVLVRRRTSGDEGEIIEYLTPGSDTPAGAAEFYQAVAVAWGIHAGAGLNAMSVAGGEREFLDQVAVSLALADLTPRGCRPRYGIGVYDERRHHGFPPATLHLVHCLVDWGYFERARELFDVYLNAFVNEDGTFDYYGPALAEYGQFLALAAHLVRLTGDIDWWFRRQSAVRPVWRRLMQLRRAALDDAGVPETVRGLVPGLPEADYHNSEDQWEQYYFSGNAWAVRGLIEIARVLDVHSEEMELVAEVAEQWEEDLLASVDASIVPTDGGPFVAPGPTQLEPFETMTRDRHASYVNYRYWPEMISAGILEPEVMEAVVQYRREHGGELLGMTRFQDHLDDWPVIHHARALLELGDTERYLLLMYAHLTQHQALGWLAAYEQVSLLPDECGLRRQVAGQVSPCQVTVPQMVRWALAYEMRDDDVLLVAPCVPWSWIAEEPLVVSNLPTRWGLIDLLIQGREDSLRIELKLPDETAPGVLVRIPTRDGRPVTGVTIDGEDYPRFDKMARVVILDDLAGEVEIEATF